MRPASYCLPIPGRCHICEICGLLGSWLLLLDVHYSLVLHDIGLRQLRWFSSHVQCFLAFFLLGYNIVLYPSSLLFTSTHISYVAASNMIKPAFPAWTAKIRMLLCIVPLSLLSFLIL